MVQINRVTTRGGDSGQTSLGDGTRVPKDDLRIELIGTIHEANTELGIVRAMASADAEADTIIGNIQNDLFDLGADLAVPTKGRKGKEALRVTGDQVARLEAEANTMNARLAPLTSFILPGGTLAAAHAHKASAVVRRAERQAVGLARREEVNPEVVRYLNRLSDHLFIMSRRFNGWGQKDILWMPGATR